MLSEEDKKQLEVPFVGKNGTTRQLEVCPRALSWLLLALTLCVLQMIMGRQKLKKSFQYEIKWRGAWLSYGRCVLYAYFLLLSRPRS